MSVVVCIYKTFSIDNSDTCVFSERVELSVIFKVLCMNIHAYYS